MNLFLSVIAAKLSSRLSRSRAYFTSWSSARAWEYKNFIEDVILGKGLFTYYVSRRRGGEGVWQMLTIADEGGEGG